MSDYGNKRKALGARTVGKAWYPAHCIGLEKKKTLLSYPAD